VAKLLAWVIIEIEPDMKIISRQKCSRRINSLIEFPLIDCQGAVVYQERRRLPDRRKKKCGLDDLKVILSKMGSD
jgi:hypothetical protein